MQNQPPVSEDYTVSAWQFEVTNSLNTNEERLNTLLEAIGLATDLADLKNRIKEL